MRKLKHSVFDFEAALSDIKNGIPVIVVDSIKRENEGDIVIAAEKANKDNIVFGMFYARGLMCIPCLKELTDRLEIPMMVPKTNDPLETPFTVSIDGITTGTGMSVDDRLKTISILLDDNSKPEHVRKPGHLFPLRARNKLLLERQGHTEAAIELMHLTGHKPIAVIQELINPDGSMSRLGGQLEKFATKHKLHIISIEEIYQRVYKV